MAFLAQYLQVLPQSYQKHDQVCRNNTQFPILISVLVSVSTAVIKQHDQKQTAEEKAHFRYMFQLQSLMNKGQSKSSRQELGGRN